MTVFLSKVRLSSQEGLLTELGPTVGEKVSLAWVRLQPFGGGVPSDNKGGNAEQSGTIGLISSSSGSPSDERLSSKVGVSAERGLSGEAKVSTFPLVWVKLHPTSGGGGTGDNEGRTGTIESNGTIGPLSMEVYLSKESLSSLAMVSGEHGLPDLVSKDCFSSEVCTLLGRGLPNTAYCLSLGMFWLCGTELNGADITFLASSPKFFEFISLALKSCIPSGAWFCCA